MSAGPVRVAPDLAGCAPPADTPMRGPEQQVVAAVVSRARRRPDSVRSCSRVVTTTYGYVDRERAKSKKFSFSFLVFSVFGFARLNGAPFFLHARRAVDQTICCGRHRRPHCCCSRAWARWPYPGESLATTVRNAATRYDGFSITCMLMCQTDGGWAGTGVYRVAFLFFSSNY